MNSKKIGLIGYGSQAKRIIKILKSLNENIETIFKTRYRTGQNKIISNDFKNIKKCNTIFILSPNSTHFKYLKIFKKNSYIFCEKPPVDKISQLNFLKNTDISRVYFNYNYRFSKINEAIKKTRKYKFGKLLYGNIAFGHGLATKKKYRNSWRNNKEGKGVYEVLGIHLIDLILNNFKIQKVETKLDSFLRKKSPDNAYFSIILKEFGQVDCFTSYTSPYEQKFNFIYENGILEINNKYIIFRGPRDTFDKKGYFSAPKVLFKENFQQIKDYDNSLRKSVKYFIKVVDNNKKFLKKENQLSILSNMYLLKKNN